ncbi:MAG: tyrosine-type recombinase/integrase [Oscillospiraceae bacterium]
MYDEKGAPITKSVTAVSKAVCQEKLEELKVKCGVVTGRAKSDMPFGEWIDLWYQTWSKPGLRITTQQCYEDRIYNHIIPHVDKIPLNKLTQSDLQQFYAELKRNGRRIRRDLYGPGLSDRMVRSCHTTCRIALEKAKTEGLIRVNPAIGCKLPPKKAREMQVLSHEEMQRFLIQAKEDGFYEMMLLELATGMRRGELCALQWDDLNLRTGELHIQRQMIHVAGALHESAPKTKKLRPGCDSATGGAGRAAGAEGADGVAVDVPSPVKEDAPLDPQSVYRKMKKGAGAGAVQGHPLPRSAPHLRHDRLEHGMDVKTLSAIIGHISSATTIDIYSHITGAMQRQAAQKIERGIGHSPRRMSPTKRWTTNFPPKAENRL